jgi:hypothetical protein
LIKEKTEDFSTFDRKGIRNTSLMVEKRAEQSNQIGFGINMMAAERAELSWERDSA